jgi:hypothetical protein
MSKKIQYTIEKPFRSSPGILYEFLTSPSALVLWFADYVDLTEDIYTFGWNGDFQEAEILIDIEEDTFRLRWLDDEDEKAFFEFKIRKSEITNETILFITDFAEKEDLKSSKDLWDSQLNDLARVVGAA